MKKILLLFVALLAVTLTNAQLVLGDTFEGSLFKYTVSTLADPAGSPNTVTLSGIATAATIPADLVIPASVTEGGFDYTIKLIGGNVLRYNSTITSLVIEGDPIFGSQAFRGCSSLKTIDLPLVTSIGYGPAEGLENETGLIFWQCAALETINMPKMEKIYTGVFNSCTALTSITFPETVTYISSQNANMFKGCANLTDVIVEYPTFIALEQIHPTNVSIFNDQIVAGNTTLTVPFGTYVDYQAADVWKDFSSISEAAEVLGLDAPEQIALGSYPNPVVDYLHFSSNDVYSVEIYNILGAKVSSQKVLNGVDMSNLNKGIYIVKAKNNEGLNISSIKVIKQ